MNKYNQKALIYCRVSSEKQVRDGHGLDSQEHRCREYAKAHGLVVEKVFPDGNITGGLFNRPAMRAMLSYLDQHKGREYTIIFDDLKRFARDVEIHYQLKAKLVKQHGASLKCLNFNFDDSPTGRFVETMMAATGQLEREQNKEQVCNKMKARLERGYWCFNAPAGYQYQKDKEHGKLICPIRPAADIIAEGLEMFANDRLIKQVDLLAFYESRTLCEYLGYKKINLDFVKRVITEILYTGQVEYPEWGIPILPGHHKAIISKEVFNKVKDKIRKPERKPRETDTLEFPLRRVVNCSVCGKPLTGSACRGKYRYYGHYTCYNKNCSASPKNIAVSKLEQDYLQLLEEIKADEETLKMVKIVAMRVWNQKMKNNSKNSDKEKEIKAIDIQIEEYMELARSTKSENVKARYEAKIEGLDLRAQELRAKLDTKKEPNFDEALDLALDFIGTPAKIWKKADKERKIQIHNLIFEENPTYSSKTGFGTPKLSLLFYINTLKNLLVVCSRQSSNTFRGGRVIIQAVLGLERAVWGFKLIWGGISCGS